MHGIRCVGHERIAVLKRLNRSRYFLHGMWISGDGASAGWGPEPPREGTLWGSHPDLPAVDISNVIR